MDRGDEQEVGDSTDINLVPMNWKGLEETAFKRKRSGAGSQSPPAKKCPALVEAEEPSFFISTTPHLFTPLPTHLYDYISTSTSSDYLSILGEPSTSPPNNNSSALQRLCFNCSSPSHVSSACPFRKDPAAIALNRQAFQLEHPSIPQTGQRLTGDTSSIERRIQFAEYFRPGAVQGERLRDALLGPERMERMETEVVEWPWYRKFIEWGYPPGYYKPIGAARTHVLFFVRHGEH